jgi:hypothetical protein
MKYYKEHPLVKLRKKEARPINKLAAREMSSSKIIINKKKTKTKICPICKCSLRGYKLDIHMRRVHKTEKEEITRRYFPPP